MGGYVGRVLFLKFELTVTLTSQSGGATYLGLLWGLTFGNYFTRVIKSKDLMVGLVRKSLGLQAECETDY